MLQMAADRPGWVRLAAGALCVAFAFAAAPAEAGRRHGSAHHRAAPHNNRHHPSPRPGPATKGNLQADVLMDSESGKVLECNHCQDKRAPASLTKLMTAMVAFDAVRGHRLSLEQKLPLADAAAEAAKGAVTLQRKGIPAGTELTVDTLLSAVAVTSAADATMTLSKGICGTASCITGLMNEKLDQIFADDPNGLHTHFVNPHGMPDNEQYTTAYDQAVILRYMIHHYRDEYAYFGKTSYTAAGRRFNGHNELLVSYQCKNAAGLDYNCMEGGKTGFFRTPEPGGLAAGFCLSGSAVWGGYRVIAVTLGYPSSASRNNREKTLFDEGFKTLVADNVAPTVRMPIHFPSLLTPTPAVEPEPDQTPQDVRTTGTSPAPGHNPA